MAVVRSPHTAGRLVPLAPVSLHNRTSLMLLFCGELTVFRISHGRKIHVVVGVINERGMRNLTA